MLMYKLTQNLLCFFRSSTKNQILTGFTKTIHGLSASKQLLSFMVILFLAFSSFQSFGQITTVGQENGSETTSAEIYTNAESGNLGCNPLVIPPEFLLKSKV